MSRISTYHEPETMTSPDPRIETGEERNRQQSKQIWVRLNGKTRPMDVSTGRKKEVEKETREMLKIGNVEVYLINCGRKLEWEDVAELEEEETVEVIVAMRRGGKRKKKGPWVSDSERGNGEENTESSGKLAGRAGTDENEAERGKPGDTATAAAKQVWFRFEGKTRLVDIWGRDLEIEKEAREKMRLGKDLDIYMTSEGRMIGWKDLEEIRDGEMIEVGLRMKGGGKKNKGTKSGNQWESLASGGESTRSEETENSMGDETENDADGRDVGGSGAAGTGRDVALV